MTRIPGAACDVHFGGWNRPLPDWREDQEEEFDPDDALLPETPPGVVAILGFDPLKVTDAP